jgi:hypothetical protein
MKNWLLELYRDTLSWWQPRVWLRQWLGVVDYTGELKRIEFRVDQVNFARGKDKLDAESKETELRQEFETALQSFQDQITELKAPDGPLATKKAPEPEPPAVMPGFRRFSTRKREYEAAHAVPLQTEVGKQIETNNKLIASGTRKPE